MEAHEKRVIEEYEELESKIAKLTSFMETEVFESILPEDKGLLMIQLEAMKMYSSTLMRRIERF